MAAGEAIRTIIKSLAEARGFDKVMKGVQLVSASTQGKCVCEMKVDESHLNGAGTLHGGMTATLLDNVSTFAIMATNAHPGVSVDLNISYLRGAKAGDEIEIRSECVKQGKTLVFATVEFVRKSDDHLIAIGRQTKYIGF